MATIDWEHRQDPNRWRPYAPQDAATPGGTASAGPTPTGSAGSTWNRGTPFDHGRQYGFSGYNMPGDENTDPFHPPYELPSTVPTGPPPTSPPPTGPQSVPGGNFQQWFMSQLAGKPFNQQTLLDLEGSLGQYGSKLTPANTQGERTKIWDPSTNQWVRVGFGEGHPVWIPQGNGSGGGGSQWGNDPATQQYQDFLQQFLTQLGGQGQQWGLDANAFRQRQGEAQAATDRLVQYLQQRAQKLQGPAFSGTEQQIMRTQALDPIEADRAAAQKRALERISGRGFLPTSGIAVDLQNQVDQPFDQARNQAQNQLAYQTIQQEHSNQQEAQQMLGLIPQAQRAGLTGDLGFLTQLNTAVNQPYQTGLPLSQEIYNLPNYAMQQANMILGQGGQSGSNAGSLAGLLAQLQQNQQLQGTHWYDQLGALLPYLMNWGK